MATMETDRLVDDYLRRLEAACAHLQRSRRAELVAEIREHIEAALQLEDAADEVAVRNVLERLGPPEEIVEATEPAASENLTRPGRLELAALVALVVPVVGWLVGIVLVVVSRAWSSRDKTVGVALGLLPALLPLVVLMSTGDGGMEEQVPVGGPEVPAGLEESGDDGGLGPVEVAVLALGFLAGLPSALYLGSRLRRGVSAS